MPYKDKATARAYAREYKRLGHSPLGKPGGKTLRTAKAAAAKASGGKGQPPGETRDSFSNLRLQSAKAFLDLIAEQANAIRQDETADTIAKGRALGYLASIGLRAIEAGQLEERLAELERRAFDNQKNEYEDDEANDETGQEAHAEEDAIHGSGNAGVSPGDPGATAGAEDSAGLCGAADPDATGKPGGESAGGLFAHLA